MMLNLLVITVYLVPFFLLILKRSGARNRLMLKTLNLMVIISQAQNIRIMMNMVIMKQYGPLDNCRKVELITESAIKRKFQNTV